jgi:hypothetical protein
MRPSFGTLAEQIGASVGKQRDLVFLVAERSGLNELNDPHKQPRMNGRINQSASGRESSRGILIAQRYLSATVGINAKGVK